jgi:hypothetical protein
MVLLWPFLLASGVYLLLRWVIRAPGGGTSAVTVSQHALWIGVIGWLASSLQSAGNAGILPAGSTAPVLATPTSILGALAWPILGCLSVHAIGQLSYPGPQLPRRSATLELRRVRDFLPRGLAWTVAAIFAGAALQIGYVAVLPAYDAVPYGTFQEGPDSFRSIGGDGRIQGSVLAACLGAGWLVLGLGAALVLMLINRRRQLEALNAAENDLLRTIAMNRLLRTVATVAAGLAAVAGNFAARPDPGANSTGWTNPSGFVALVVLVAMWWWAPPKLARANAGGGGLRTAESPAATHSAARLSVSLGAAMGIAPVAAAVLGILVPGFFRPGGFPGQQMLFVPLIAATLLLVAGAGELLLQGNYGSREVPRTWPRQVVSPALLTTAIIAVALYLAITAVTAVGGLKLREAGFVAAFPSDNFQGGAGGWAVAAVATAVVAAAAWLPVAVARQRRSISTDIPGLDAALRAITVHRVVRTLAAYCAAQGGVLLMSASNAWPPALNLPSASWDGTWQPAVIAGALLTAVGVVIAVIPVKGFARVPASPGRSVPEAAR